ncbi:hypothetical protein CI610_02969 [invertebrate metagenome]|uniref:Core-binding (CB) domain-containing protein n=1 Tax=invertebrate metagenome TaxID=1711999 RepID=A0A2H9T4G8_9ZZZZ
MFTSSDSTVMAEAALVSTVAVPSGRPTSTVTSQLGPSAAASVKVNTSTPRDPPPSRVEAIKEGLSQAGFSSEVSDCIARSLRSSSSAIYQSRWRIFCDWCDGRQVDPVKAYIQLIADFLLSLFRDRSLAPGTVAGYRSALASIFSVLDRPEVGSSPSLSAMIRGFRLDQPRVRQLAPQWDLSFVLDSLTKAPFEPLGSASLKFITLKTVFLVALAPGRRGSEVHALSYFPSYLRWSRNFSAYSLCTDTGFFSQESVSWIFS